MHLNSDNACLKTAILMNWYCSYLLLKNFKLHEDGGVKKKYFSGNIEAKLHNQIKYTFLYKELRLSSSTQSRLWL